jgi:hypothetical protein
VAEAARLKRFLHDERALCSYAAVNLKPEHFEDYRDRRLKHRLKNGKTIIRAKRRNPAIRYTDRIPITQEFVPTEREQALYDMVSDYLRRPPLQALPSSQRTLMTLIRWPKFSSGPAGSASLRSIRRRSWSPSRRKSRAPCTT